VLLSAIGVRGVSELRLAGSAALIGALCTAWFGLWTSSADALYGVHLSLASSLGLSWARDLARRGAGPARPRGPRAVVRRR